MTKITTTNSAEFDDSDLEETGCNNNSNNNNNYQSSITFNSKESKDKCLKLATAAYEAAVGKTRQVNSDDNNDSLRPKFAIIKHKTETSRQQTSYNSNHSMFNTSEGKATTPAWFFNIPTVRSPFPDFGSKLPQEDD